LSGRGHGIGKEWKTASWDPGILRDLKKINTNPDLVTTASCSGMHEIGPFDPDAGAFLNVRVKDARLVAAYAHQLKRTRIPVRILPKQRQLMVGWGRHTSPEEAQYFWEEVPKALAKRLET